MSGSTAHDVPVFEGVKVQVAPLNHVDAMLPEKSDQGVRFLRAVGKTRAVQIVYGHKFTALNGNIDAFDHIGEIIPLWLEIDIVTFFTDAVQTDADTVKAGIEKLFEDSGPAAVGVHVDGTAGGNAANRFNGRLNDLGRQQGLAFTALPKADDAAFYPPDVFQGYGGDLGRGRPKSDPFLTDWDLGAFLRREAAQTACIATDGRRQRCLVSS